MVAPQTHPPLTTTSESVRQRVADTKRRVCEVAARKFNAASFDGVSVEDILRDTGIARSTFYRFFPDKSAVLKEILDPVFSLACAHLEKLESSPPEAIVNGIADAHLAVWRTYPDGLLLTQNIGMSLFPLVQATHDPYAEAIRRLMDRLFEARMLRNDDPELSAILLARSAVSILRVCACHPQFENVFRDTLRGLLLKW